MFEAFLACCRRVLSHYAGGFGAFISLIGTLLQWIGVNFIMPSWGWIALGALLLFITAVRIEWELLEEKNKRRKPTPTLSLADLVKRITKSENLNPLLGSVPGLSQAIGEALVDIRQKANLGLINVFGRPGRVFPGHENSYPLDKIDQTHWRAGAFDIDYMEFLQDNRGETQNINRNPGYTDLMFDSIEIEEYWPKPRKRIDWKNPLRFRDAA